MKRKDNDIIRLVTGNGMWKTAKIKGVNQLHLSDGPHGLRKQEKAGLSNNNSNLATCFPTACACACSYNKELLYKMGMAIGKEAKNQGVNIVLGPGIGMKRSMLCGRNFEYYSEDPYLNGVYGASFINGCEFVGIGTSLKHFACNNQETNRMVSNSVVDIRALREIYLRGFEYAVKNSNPATIMASYNKINGVYSTQNKWLLTDVLRKEWGYDGVVVSDWGACCDLTASLKAGMDLEMPDSRGIHYKRVIKDIKKENISINDIKINSDRVRSLIDKYSFKDDTSYDISDNHRLAYDIECESAVLLKNNGILPLKSKSIKVIGSLAKNIRYQGGGSSHVNTNMANDFITIINSKNYTYEYYQGYNDINDKIDDKLIKEVIDNIKSDDIILFFGGLPDFAEGEGYDRDSYDMPNNQRVLLDKITEINNNVIFISFSGSSYDMYFESKVAAILQMYLGGEAVCEAAEAIISGDINPSGRLSETYPLRLEDNPSYGNFAGKDTNILYKESIFVGYRYYDTYNVIPRFSFGYGLSYSKFEYSNLKVDSKYSSGKLKVLFDIKNVSDIKGKISTLIYIQNPEGSYIRENKVLKEFVKCELMPHETKTLEVYLDENAFNLYDNKKGFIIPKGIYKIIIGGAINESYLQADIEVDGIEYNRVDDSIYMDKNNKIKDISDEDFTKLLGFEISNNIQKRGSFDFTTSLEVLKDYSLLAKMLYKIGIRTIKKHFKNKSENDPEVKMMLQTLKEGTFDSVCVNSGILGARLEDFVILSANGHKFKALLKLIFG